MSTSAGIPNEIIQLSINYDRVCDAVVLYLSKALLNFKQRSGIISVERLPVLSQGRFEQRAPRYVLMGLPPEIILKALSLLRWHIWANSWQCCIFV